MKLVSCYDIQEEPVLPSSQLSLPGSIEPKRSFDKSYSYHRMPYQMLLARLSLRQLPLDIRSQLQKPFDLLHDTLVE